MSDLTVTEDELTKLKLTDLKKLCRKHSLSTNGTKMELVSRLLEIRNESYTILQPGDEAKLLGDVDEDATPFSLSNAVAFDSVDKSPTNTSDKAGPISTSSASSEPVTGSICAPVVSTTAIHTKTSSKVNNDTSAPLEKQPVLNLSPEQRLTMRANRFGVTRPPGLGSLSNDKLAARARRFGLPITENGNSGLRTAVSDDADKRKRRAERFGIANEKVISDAERKAIRLERFGSVRTESSSSDLSKDTVLKTTEDTKLNIETDEEKLSKRKTRFGMA